ncbi:MAG: B12-binding domain-containing radical SAM protein [Desulfobacter sp.]|nr:MAG: B12-binding domain-containing radical SAM protein [Desulfobacter sp.]
MPRVVLVQPPIREFYLTRKRTIPYGLAAIAAGLKKEGFETRIIDGLATAKSKPRDWPGAFHYLAPFYGRTDSSPFALFHRFSHFGYSHQHIARLVRDARPMAVGISSLFTAYAGQALAAAAAIKRFCPDVPVIMGGHHPTLFPREVLSAPEVDFIIRGEGEAAMAVLCRALEENRRDLENIPGIGFKKNRSFHINPPAWIEDLETLPLPARETIDWKFYRRKKKAAITIVASRGCPFPCSYCSVSSASSHGRFRRRSVDAVLEEIRGHASEQKIGFIDFEDENLTLKKEWILALLAGIRKIFKGEEVELRAMNGLYPPSLDEEIIHAMKISGFKTLNLSVGSFSKSQLHKFNRPDVRAAHDRALDLAHTQGMDCVSYIIGAAPGQTAATSLEDILMLARRRTLAGFSVFYPAPGSRDYSRCQEQGLLPTAFSLMRSTALPLDHTTSRLEAVTLLRLTRMLNFMKSLVDTEGELPRAEPARTELPSDRHDAGKTLIKWFLNDGIIRGVDREGRAYAHTTDRQLTRQFLERIRTSPVAGVIRAI